MYRVWVYSSTADADNDSNRLYTLTTDANGNTNTISDVLFGKYYVKEVTPSPGFALDDTPYTIDATDTTVEDGHLYTVQSTEIPKSDPVDILGQKIDNEDKDPDAQGVDPTFEGAEFTVKFYGEDLSGTDGIDPATLGKTPLRTWVLRTDSDGYCAYNKDYLVSGDALYTNLFGTYNLPLGTVTIEETKAPNGYNLTEQAIGVYYITAGNNNETYDASSTLTEETAKVVEQVKRFDVRIIKTQAEPDYEDYDYAIPVEGAQFTFYDSNGDVVKDSQGNPIVLTTNEDGYATTKDLFIEYEDNLTVAKVIFNKTDTDIGKFVSKL